MKSSTTPEAPGRQLDLEIEGVSLAFGGLIVLNDVGLRLQARSVLGLIGSNGSGKTSLLNCISGVYRPQKGRIRLGSVELVGLRPHVVAAAGVGRTFQHIEVPLDLTALELAMLGRHASMRKHGLISYGVGLPFALRFEDPHREIAMDALRRVGLERFANARIGDLPYGLAKRADLARALAGEPRVLLLDEPAAGLNEQERASLGDLLLELAESDLTIALIEHDMSFVTRVCSRLAVLASGRKVFDGSTDQALADQGVVRAFMGSPAEPHARPPHPASDPSTQDNLREG